MSLLTCVDCGGKVSDEAVSCPHCGKPAPVEATHTASDPAQVPPDESLRESLPPKVGSNPAEQKDVPIIPRKRIPRINRMRCMLPVLAIIAAGVHVVAILVSRTPHFPRGFTMGEPNLFPFTYWLVFGACASLLAVGLPCMANLLVRGSRPIIFPILGLILILPAFLMWITNLSFHNIIIPLSGESEFSGHWWVKGDPVMFSLWCGRGGQLAYVLSILCLTVTCLCFKKKLLGIIALPFCLVYGVVLILSVLKVDLMMVASYIRITSATVIILLCSIATISDEKARARKS